MADVTELRMNVTALKRVDPYAKDIIETARHVAFYSFNSNENEWERTNIEGALFIYSRNGEPYHGILIINRLNRNNLVEPVVKGLDLQLQEPFLLYRNSNNSIRGFWFYDREDCVKVAQLLQRLIADLQPSALHPEMLHNTQQNQTSEPVDIFSMLTRAQEDFNSQHNPQASTGQPEHALHTPKPDVTSQSVMEFFAKATTSSQSNAPLFVAPRAPAEQLNSEQHLLQRLMSNPAHSVEHIEKQQRSVTPQDLLRPDERRGFPMQPLSSSTMAEVSPVSLPQLPGLPIDHKTILIENGLSFMRITSPNQGTSPLNAFFNNKNTNNSENEPRPVSAPLCNIDTPQKPALMPPTMFTSSANKEPWNHMIDQGDIIIKPEPLTRNQLLQAITYLLKTEPEFVNKLHEAYLKSFNEIVN